MSDKQSAAILIIMAAVGFIVWYRGRSAMERSRLFGITPSDVPESSGDKNATSGVPVLPSVSWKPGMTSLERLMAFAKAHGLYVTSSTGGKHNVGSSHYQGRAIDVRTRGVPLDVINDVIQSAKEWGIKVRDERSRPAGQKVWSGPHLHLEYPKGK